MLNVFNIFLVVVVHRFSSIGLIAR